MAEPHRKAVFVLAACDDGPMIVARTDFQMAVRGLNPIMHLGVGMSMLEIGSHEQHHVDLMLQLTSARRQLYPDANISVVDCGANIGGHLVGWAKFMTGWGSIIGIEPQERVFYALCGNIAINNLANARAIWAAASNEAGMMPAPTVDYEKPFNFGGVSMIDRYNDDVPVQDYFKIVQTVTIDSLKLPRLDVLKIDAEGMEPQIIAGARAMIEKHRPIISAETLICGVKAVHDALPSDYHHEMGVGLVPGDINMIAMHRDDPTWGKMRIIMPNKEDAA